MSDALSLALLTAGFVVVGVVSGHAAGLPLRRAWLPTLLGAAPLMGALVCGLSAVLLLAVGVAPRPVVVVGLALVLVTGVLCLRRPREEPWPIRPRSHPLPGLVAEVAVVAAFVPVAGAVVRLAAASPLGGWDGWDGWAIWGLKAHAIYLDGGLGGPVFLDPAYGGSHQEYPVLHPALAAVSSSAIGRFDPRLVDVVSAIVLVSFGLAVWAVLRTLMPRWAGASVGLAAIGTWPVVVNATTGYADAMLADTVAFGVMCGAVWVITESNVALVLALGALAAAGLVKAEGLLFAIAAIVSLLLAGRIAGRALLPLAAYCGLAVVPAVAWLVLRGAGGADGDLDPGMLVDPGAMLRERSRASAAFEALLRELLSSWRLSVVLCVLGLALALLAHRLALIAYTLVWSALSVAGLIVVYLISRTEIGWHLQNSAGRVVYGIGLVLGVVGPLMAVSSWDTIAERRVAVADRDGPLG